jgi:hypothetical protein
MTEGFLYYFLRIRFQETGVLINCVIIKKSIVVWNVATKEPICGSPAQHKSAGVTYCLAASSDNDNSFYSAGR